MKGRSRIAPISVALKASRQQQMSADEGPRHSDFDARVHEILPDTRIISDELRRVVLGSDASCYGLIPRLVLLVENEDEVKRIVELACELSVPLTFRAAGTSLSGQAVTDSVLVKLGDNGWRHCTVSDDGSRVLCGPALTGAQVNRRLMR